MHDQTIDLQTADRIMIASIVRPIGSTEDLTQLAEELALACQEAASSDEVRVFMLTGHSHAFSPDMAAEEINNGPAPVPSPAAPLAALRMPVIAAIPGDALDQGLEMALACDIRIAADTSHFGLTQIRKGLIPRDGGTQRLARIVGRPKASEMIFTGDTIDAAQALRIGLIHRTAALPEVLPAATRMAQEMAAKSPLALCAAKEAVYQGLDLTLPQGLALEADLYFLLHTSADRTEGITAFREKRHPDFKGR